MPSTMEESECRAQGDCQKVGGFFQRWWKCSKTDSGNGCTQLCKYTKTTELHTLNGWIVWLVNISMNCYWKEKRFWKNTRKHSLGILVVAVVVVVFHFKVMVKRYHSKWKYGVFNAPILMYWIQVEQQCLKAKYGQQLFKVYIQIISYCGLRWRGLPLEINKSEQRPGVSARRSRPLTPWGQEPRLHSYLGAGAALMGDTSTGCDPPSDPQGRWCPSTARNHTSSHRRAAQLRDLSFSLLLYEEVTMLPPSEELQELHEIRWHLTVTHGSVLHLVQEEEV